MSRILVTDFLVLMVSLFSCKEKKSETVLPTIAPITEAVFASGHIEAANQFTLTAVNDGYLTNVLVKEGDIVTTGKTLFTQDNKTASIQQNTATENLRIAELQESSNSALLQQLQSQLTSAIQKMENDKIQLGRMQRLYTTNSVAKLDLDNAQLSYNNSENNVDAIEQTIEATKLSLKQTVVNSRSQEQTARVNKSYFNIESPGNYKIFSVLKKEGELVRKGERVALLGIDNVSTIVLSVDETGISKVQLRQKVLIELNTEKGQTYTASVSKIYPLFDAESQAYKIEAVFDTIPSKLINGALLQANIIVSKKEKAFLIPRRCLSPDNKVIIQRMNKTDTVSVKTGIVSTEWVEILHGVAETDKLIKTF